MSLLFRFFLITFTSTFISCAVLQKRTAPIELVDPEKIELENIDAQMNQANYLQVISSAEKFQAKYPYSLKLQKARFFKARAYEELERWTEAADTYRIISLFSERNQPEISAISIYRLSFVYEALGDDQRVLTTLLEAQQYATYLPMEVHLAEIPSRIAMVYAKENNATEAGRWLQKADEGLKKTLESRQEPLTNAWLAKTYYNMGSISTSQLSADNIGTIIQGQKAVQKYLIRSLQYGDRDWSAKAAKRLQSTYTDIWNAIETLPEPAGFEAVVAKKMKSDEQAQLVGPFSTLIQDAQIYRPVADQKTNSYQASFFDFLEKMRERVGSTLQNSLITPLTTGQAKTPQRAKAPVKIIPSEDPNL
jgi:outer membrane protein assembly factor BamD (BamD/ComL family)